MALENLRICYRAVMRQVAISSGTDRMCDSCYMMTLHAYLVGIDKASNFMMQQDQQDVLIE